MRQFFLILPFFIIFQGCSYLDAMKRAKLNEEIKGTNAYYDQKCLVSDECMMISAKVILPLEERTQTLAFVTVIQDGNESRAIDVQLLNFATESNQKEKSAYYFLTLPMGEYTGYIVKVKEHTNFVDEKLEVLKKFGPYFVLKNDLKAYNNSYIEEDIYLNPQNIVEPFNYSLRKFHKKLLVKNSHTHHGYFESDVNLDDPIFSHTMALEGLYYPESFSSKTKALYRLTPSYIKGTIPLIFVHGMAGTPLDWKYIINHVDLEKYTPYLAYYPSGEDYTKLSAMFSGWILSEKIFKEKALVIIAHSFGGVIVRDALNRHQNKHNILFISLASPFGGDAKASEGVKNAPYVLPAWKSIADDGVFIKNLYRTPLTSTENYSLIFAYNNHDEGPSGDSRIPLKKQLRKEALKEANNVHGVNEDHISILKSNETSNYINELLQKFAQKNLLKAESLIEK